MWEAIGYRRLQAVTIALLAALITACVVFAPLYERAMIQALTQVELAQASPTARGLHVESQPVASLPPVDAGTPAQVASLVPATVRRAFEPPIGEQRARTSFGSKDRTVQGAAGDIVARVRSCQHITVLSGRCPRAPGEIAITPADTRNFALSVGSTVVLDQGHVELRIVGTYRAIDGPYWFGAQLTGFSGVQIPYTQVTHDPWLTPSSTLTEPRNIRVLKPTTTLDYGLDVPHTGVDELLALAPTLTRLSTRLAADPVFGDLTVRTSIPGVAVEVRHQHSQADVTVPLLMVQLTLLAVIALALVLGAATEQRRPEVAVAMLRGRGRRGAQALLLRELVPVVLAGVLVGLGAALLLGGVARAALPGQVPFELGVDPLLATLAAALVVLLLVLLVVVRVSREPVEHLLRRVPARRTGWALGALEAVLIAAAATVVVAFVTGGLSGPIALAAPLLLAVVVGLLLAHATTPLAALVGRRLLASGRVGLGVSVLDAARTPTTRRTIALMTVAAALLGFTATAVTVGSRNRTVAAAQEAGAPMRVRVDGQDLAGVRAAIAEVDPTGRSLTPVLTVQPPGQGAATTMAVDPAGFARIALFADDAPLDPDLLAATRATPIRLEGDRLGIDLSAQRVTVVQPGDGAPTASVELRLATAAGDTSTVSLGDLPIAEPSRPRHVTAPIACRSGCFLVGVSIVTRPGARVRGAVTLSDLTADAPVALGPTSRWRRTTVDSTDQLVPDAPSDTELTVTVSTTGSRVTTMGQSWIPDRIPTVAAGVTAAGSNGDGLVVSGLDGVDRPARIVARVSRVPGADPVTRLVNLDVLSRAASTSLDDRIEVWFAGESTAELSRLSTALGRRGIIVDPGTATLTATQRSYDESVAAWSLALAVVVGVVGLLIGLLVVLILAVNTWRSRAHDLAVLRLGGMRGASIRTVATLAQLPALAIAVVAGTVCGAVGAHFALPTVPLFASAPRVSTLDLSLPWPALLTVAVIALALALGVGWVVGASITRRATLERLREAV